MTNFFSHDFQGFSQAPHPPPYIDSCKLEKAEEIVYLGDVVNKKGNNNSLIEDRQKRSMSVMIRLSL